MSRKLVSSSQPLRVSAATISTAVLRNRLQEHELSLTEPESRMSASEGMSNDGRLGHSLTSQRYLSCVVDCPYDGRTSPLVVLKMAKEMLEMGCFEISLGDTTGTATPTDIHRLLETLLREIPATKLAGHFHDSFGQAIVNVKEAYRMGIRTFDSSVGGLGGCPYSPGAKGNVATEDVVCLFENMGVNTGVDLTKLAHIGDWITQQLRVSNGSQMYSALVANSKRAAEARDTHKQTSAISSEWQHLSHMIC